MQFARPPRKPRSESIVPMINVVFLLLIFFLMTAQIAPPEPFAVTPPETSSADPADGGLTLYISDQGQLAFRDARDQAALTALSAALTPDAPVQVRADARAPATALARLLPQLAALGLTQVQLITVTP
ncbi:biopolymer transporter ExbD [Thalassobius vesicularis]|uniref:Biopolymer transporter ExbD n=1 Tax=Thalassobius vesicularis TaxID=1294297 RepID=A0A4V3UZ95_9RHOB|nr:biopolymer transporter ExbD [Thalassobius vesicularis]THD75789.1 biopolymer transporter ExbD [Thalassobius vesicularis]